MDAKKETFVKALYSNFGHITKACKICGVSRSWYYIELDADQEFRDKCLNVDEYILDDVEESLLDQIKEGNTTATIFYLKTKGKKRGYVEKTEVEHSGSINMPLIIDWTGENTPKSSE